MTTDSLNAWEKWPIAGLVASAGVNTAIWYVGATLGGSLPLATQIMVTLAAVASVVAIDGALIATIAGMRAGRRSFWSAANILVAALFTGLAALSAHGVLPNVGPWLHGFFAVTLVTYAMHLAQPRVDSIRASTGFGNVDEVIEHIQFYHQVNAELMIDLERERAEIKRLQALQPRQLPSPREAWNWDGYVYVAKNEQGAYKIGMAKDVEARMKGLRTVVHIDLILTIETDNRRILEKRLHECFADRRLRGEWFALTEADLDALQSIGEQIHGDDIDDTIDMLSVMVNPPTLLELPAKDDLPEIVRLKDIDKFTFTQIGDQLGVTRQAAWQQYKAAKKQEAN